MMLHLDADAFFAAVEQAADPRLRGRPVAVGGDRRGIIASASYEARKFGVFTPMPTARARKLCPKLIVLPGDFEKYERFSRLMFSYAYDFTPLVEVGSIDEGYLDLSGCRRQAPLVVAETMRRAISESLRITISEGWGKNKLVAQIASKLRKPASFVEVPDGGEIPFLHPLAATWLPGVGPVLGATLRTAGLATIGQVASMRDDLLGLLVGGYAPQLRAYARGIDHRPVVPDPPAARSYGTQETFAEDVTDEIFLLARLRVMADSLMSRVREDRKAIRTVTVRLRYNDLDECQRSQSLNEPADLEHDIYPLLPRLLSRAWERRVSVRLLGLRLTNIYGGVINRELPLEGFGAVDERRRRLTGVVDGLKSRHFSIMRGHDLWLKRSGNRPRPALVAGPMAKAESDKTTDRVLRERPQADVALKPAHPTWSSATPLALLNLKSCYSFLDSTLTIPALIAAAVERGVETVALTDPNLHGAIPFYEAAKAAGLKPIIGAEVVCGGQRLNGYAENAGGYENLCRLLSFRNDANVTREQLASHRAGLIIVPADTPDLALPEIRYATPADALRYEIVQSIRTRTLLRESHPKKRRGAFHWPDADERRRRFGERQQRATADLADRCAFDFEFQTLRFPHYAPADGSTPAAFLRRLAEEGLQRRYGDGAERHAPQLREELAIIGEVGYEEYFLIVWDLLMECRRRGIYWITRGSAADSLVCYCLEISNVCPIRFELYFKRFLNRDRMALQKLPDIDVDFAHDRKDDVVNLLLDRYGPDHAAVVGGFSTFQARSAVAEVAKVLGVADREIRRLTERFPHYAYAADAAETVANNRAALDFPCEEEPYRTALAVASFLDGFPRYPKMHPCGVVVSRDPLHRLTPTFQCAKGWRATHFDMEAVEAVGLIKLDILAQGGLAVLRDAQALLAERGLEADLESLAPWEDGRIWDLVAAGDSRGVHHIESPAMISLARMAGVRDIDRLVAIVSVIRPGAANGLKKAQFARRAQGLEPVEYPHPSLEPALRSTFGVVAYEEHILQICEAFAGLAPGRADVLRRALVKLDQRKIDAVGAEFVAAARKLGRSEPDIVRVWELVAGFQGYAFCRAHSTAYAVEAYQGAWFKRYHPAEFLAAVLTNGKGFYSSLAYTLECRRLGLGFRSPDVNTSRDGFCVEYEGGAPRAWLRVPLRRIKGLSEALLTRHADERAHGCFGSLAEYVRRVRPQPAEMLTLIRVGAFDGFGSTRPAQFWQARYLGVWPEGEGALFATADDVPALPSGLSEPDQLARLRDEMEWLGFTVSGHPLDVYPDVAWTTYCPIARLADFPGQCVTVCGLIIEERLHEQTTGELMKFITLCDYTGMIECEIFAAAYRRWGLATLRHPVVEVTARVSLFENGQGCTLTVEHVGKPRLLAKSQK